MTPSLQLKTFKQPVAGKDYIPVTGKIIEEDDLLAGIEAVSDGWLTAGRFSNAFEKEFAAYFGAPRALLVNSGSSANLAAFNRANVRPVVAACMDVHPFIAETANPSAGLALR